MTAASLGCQRSLFDIPEDVTYLNCAYQGVQLKSSTRLATGELRRKSRPWSITADDFFTPAETLRERFARLIDANPADIAIVPSVSYAMATAATNLPIGESQHTVVLAEQFPSHVYAWNECQGQHSRVTTVQRPADNDWTDRVIDAIDIDCAVAALPGVHWTDGYQLELGRISRHCRANNTALVLDLTQSLGAIPFSVKDIEADFVATSVYKWMLGPPGLCLLYVNPRHHRGRPIELNWISRRNSQNFAALTSYTKEFQPGARRYDAGGRANPVNMAIAITALEQIHTWGIDQISSYTSALTGLAARMAGERGLACTPAKYRPAHMLGVQLPDIAARRIATELHERKVYVSLRGNKLRISPHLYNSTTDIKHLFTVLDESL